MLLDRALHHGQGGASGLGGCQGAGKALTVGEEGFVLDNVLEDRDHGGEGTGPGAALFCHKGNETISSLLTS